jgi:hypothetical protein
VLKIDNDLVRNQLIINQGIDQTVLISDRQEAVDTNMQRHRNVKQIFCLHDDQRQFRGRGHRLNLGSSGDPTVGPINAWARPPRMQADVKDQIA